MVEYIKDILNLTDLFVRQIGDDKYDFYYEFDVQESEVVTTNGDSFLKMWNEAVRTIIDKKLERFGFNLDYTLTLVLNTKEGEKRINLS